MYDLPEYIEDERQLDDVSSRPSAALTEFMSDLEGDILVLGAGGKMGPALTRMAARAIRQADVSKLIIAVGRRELPQSKEAGIETLVCDLLDYDAVKKLPDVDNIVYMAGRKFGSTGSEWLTWAANVILPYHVASKFSKSRIVVFSTGCVYPVMDVKSGGSVETDKPEPVGEYSMSCLGRERVFDYLSMEKGEKVVHIRLNYSLELRYGVLVDIATKVFNGEPVDVTTGFFNGIWQGDACDQILRSIALASSPPEILNVTGPEILSVRKVAEQFGRIFGKEVIIAGEENGFAYLSNASKANGMFANPSVSVETIIKWVADWIQKGGRNIGKPTHFETQDGKY